nr:Toll/interleukin-1 receptor (TIR) domain-containing protein [Tanacetum cinerariifolium]
MEHQHLDQSRKKILKELFNRLCQCEKDEWLSLRDWFWSSFMPPYKRKYVDVKFGGKDLASVTDADRTPFKALKSTATSLTFMFVLLDFGRRIKRWTKGNLHPTVQRKRVRDESKLIQLLVDVIFKKKFSTLSNADGKLVGMETRISDVISSLEIGIEDVRKNILKAMMHRWKI